jgi:2-polyprenyl-3-methyl-5-hydroxy-6-metoxy-1,4-benzoquinol methylase
MVSENGTKSLYISKQVEYFEEARFDISNVLPESVPMKRVLEIGCGSGKTLEWLKKTGRCEWVGAVELNPGASEQARTRVDMLYEENIETYDIPIEENSLDLILCLDVLEHLIDPWSVIQKLSRLIKPGGHLIASIPNIRHHTALIPLLLNGKWNYQKEGILDKSHLRFFVKDTAIDLVEFSGLTVKKIFPIGLGVKAKIFNSLTLSLFQDFLTLQYLIRAQKK